MHAPTHRTLVVAALALAATLAGTAPAAAAAPAAEDGRSTAVDAPTAAALADGGDDRCDRGNSGEHRNDTDCGDDGNASIALRLDAAGDDPGGEGHYVCEGTPDRHDCDKAGELTVGPASVDYDGRNYANATGLYGGGYDYVTVTAANRSGTGGFDCDLRPSTLAEGPCSVTANASEGSAPSPPGAP